MRNQTKNRECVAVIGSMTQSMQAQSVLAMAAVRAEIIKADSSQARRGCTYGLAYPCEQAQNVERILRNAGVRVLYYQGGGLQ